MPKYVDDRAGIDSVWGGVSKREVRSYGRENSKLYYQERVAVIWIEKVKVMGTCALDGVVGGRGSAEDRVILADMSNVGMFKRVHKAASNPPIEIVVSDVRALGNRDLSGTWYFSNFFLLIFMTFCLLYFLHILFSQFHSS